MESRKVYAFVLCVGGEIKQLITTLSCEETDVVKFLHAQSRRTLQENRRPPCLYT